jgi:5-methylcytosine-specific restriction endonuclease McrA
MSRRKFTPLEKRIIQERAGYCCEYCKFPMLYSHDSFHIEHILPIKFGGTNELDNLAWACDGSNTNKGSYIQWIDPVSGVKLALFNPRQDVWKNHFQWNEDFSTIITLTPVAGATLDLLKMNRLGLVNIRKALFVYGVLPVV